MAASNDRVSPGDVAPSTMADVASTPHHATTWRVRLTTFPPRLLVGVPAPLRLARKVLGLIRAAGAVIDRMLRIRAQRTRARRIGRVALLRDDPRRRLAAFDPAVDRRRPVRVV